MVVAAVGRWLYRHTALRSSYSADVRDTACQSAPMPIEPPRAPDAEAARRVFAAAARDDEAAMLGPPAPPPLPPASPRDVINA